MTWNDHGNGREAPCSGPLSGIRVLDLSTVYAAPIAAMLLGDYGAEVLKVEHPRGDPARTHGHNKDGHGLWWKVISRNKQTVTLNLSHAAGREMLERLVLQADVVIENFRPGVMEGWGLGPQRLHELNSALVILRVDRVRPVRPVRDPQGVRNARRGDERLRASDRAARWAADTPAVRARRRCDRTRRCDRGPARPLSPPQQRRTGAGDRRLAARAAADAARTRPERVRPVGHRSRSPRQPLAQQRAAQHLYDQRRPLGGDLRQRNDDRRAGDASRRPSRHRRAAVVLLRARARAPRRPDRRHRRTLDQSARP